MGTPGIPSTGEGSRTTTDSGYSDSYRIKLTTDSIRVKRYPWEFYAIFWQLFKYYLLLDA